MGAGREWYEGVYNLLASHQFYTNAARQRREEGKLGNMHKLEKIINGG
ncbi:hypothetical protein HZB88_00705 [archaeon]|nr:hypothetical protein [archaeon]